MSKLGFQKGVAVVWALVAAGGTLALPASASASTTIGFTFSPHSEGVTGPATFVQAATAPASPSYVVPPGGTLLTSFSTFANGDPAGADQVKLKVFRPTPTAPTYKVVGESPAETITHPGALNTFAVSVPVAPGDVIGIAEVVGAPGLYGYGGTEYGGGAAGDVAAVRYGEDMLGSTPTFNLASNSAPDSRIDVSAVVGPPPVPSASCASVVRQSVRLQHDITNCPGPGLIVGASNITIDLNGHTIGFNGGPNISFPTRSNKEPFVNVTVQNGTLRNTGTAVEGIANQSRFTNLTLFNLDTGFDMAGRQNRYTFNTFHDSGGGIALADNAPDIGSSVSNNTFTNVGLGVFTEGLLTSVSNNTFTNGDYAITLGGEGRATVRGNVASGFGGSAAIFVKSASGPGNLLISNNTSNNSNDGIGVNNGSGTTLTRNTANDNGGHGINAPGANDGGGNGASGNLTPPDCIGVVC